MEIPNTMFLERLKAQVDAAIAMNDAGMLRIMSESERIAFYDLHPGALCVIGDFEIRCTSEALQKIWTGPEPLRYFAG